MQGGGDGDETLGLGGGGKSVTPGSRPGARGTNGKDPFHRAGLRGGNTPDYRIVCEPLRDGFATDCGRPVHPSSGLG